MHCLVALAVLWFTVGGIDVSAQTDGILQVGDPMHHVLEYHRTQGDLGAVTLSTRPLSVYEARAALDTLAQRDSPLLDGERRRLRRLQGHADQNGAHWGRALWSPLYANGFDFLSTSGEGYALQANPLGYYSYGRTGGDAASTATWRNTRGVRLSGHLGPHVYFEARATENQFRPADAITLEPGTTSRRLGFVNVQVDDIYDYFTATGLIGYRRGKLDIRFGRGRHRWGPGIGSLNLSNFATDYQHVQIQATHGRVQLTTQFARFLDGVDTVSRDQGGAIQPRTYATLHRIVVRVTDRLQLEAFETVLFAPDVDNDGRRTDFQAEYVNPLPLYHTILDGFRGENNVLVGAGTDWVVVPGIRVYGQFVVNDLELSALGGASWRNQWGSMIGAHLVRVGLPYSSVRVEVTRQRPYLYAHKASTGFTHYGDRLSHPAGPNSVDAALFFDYRPPSRWQAELSVSYTVSGRGTQELNVGADPQRSTETRVRSEEVTFLQGVRHQELIVEGHLSWEVLPRLYVDGTFRARAVDDAEQGTRRYVNPSIALRWGLPFASRRY